MSTLVSTCEPCETLVPTRETFVQTRETLVPTRETLVPTVETIQRMQQLYTSLDALLDRYTMKAYLWGPNQRLEPKQTLTLMSRHFEAFLVFALLKTDNPDVSVDLYWNGSVGVSLSPKLLYDTGLLCPQAGTTACVSRYDTDDTENKQYVAMFSPPLWVPWKGYARITVENKSMEPAHFTFWAWLLERVKR